MGKQPRSQRLLSRRSRKRPKSSQLITTMVVLSIALLACAIFILLSGSSTVAQLRPAIELGAAIGFLCKLG